MGRSKPRTNKRPPPKTPKTVAPGAAPQLSAANHARPHSTVPPFDPHQAQDIALSLPPAAAMNPNDPAFSQALQNWSAQALGRLDQLPKFSQAQLNALASAAAGMGDALGGGTGNTSNPNLPVDLPASLAALFEAKLTLDREKAKLMRMQNELKGYREGVAAVQSNVVTNGKGKEAVREDDYGECTCGRAHGHAYAGSAHSGEFEEEDEYYDSEYECEDCDCDCHYECEHEDDCDCEVLDEEDHVDHGHHHHHHHHHHHEHEHDHGEDSDECLDDDHAHHHHHHHHHRHTDDLPDVNVVPNPYLKNQPQMAQYPMATGNGELHETPWPQYAQTGSPRKPISEDPERLEVAVSELFRWIKAVVWTLEQTKKMSGRAMPQAQTATGK